VDDEEEEAAPQEEEEDEGDYASNYFEDDLDDEYGFEDGGEGEGKHFSFTCCRLMGAH
jgi:hypothetical protein